MRYHDITKEDMLNGDGLRTVLWVSGCSHHCKGCHNSITWNPQEGLLFNQAAKQELLEALQQDYISGITFSGGDPLYVENRQEITQLACDIRQTFPDKTIWLYTGFSWEEICQLPIIKYIDVLVDGRYEVEKRDINLHWRGSANQRVIDVQQTLQQGRIILHISE